MNGIHIANELKIYFLRLLNLFYCVYLFFVVIVINTKIIKIIISMLFETRGKCNYYYIFLQKCKKISLNLHAFLKIKKKERKVIQYYTERIISSVLFNSKHIDD